MLDLDVSERRVGPRLVEHVIDRFGRHRRPGQQRRHRLRGAAEESSVAQAASVFDVNVFGVIRMTKAVLPHMRAQRRGRIINVSSVARVRPRPYMAVYAASKHAIEGYSESLDHEVREYGVRVCSSSPAYDQHRVRGQQRAARHAHAGLRAAAANLRRRDGGRDQGGDDPAVVAKVIVAAATDAKPKLRYPAGPLAGRVSALRRVVPARVFDKQIRKLNRLAG